MYLSCTSGLFIKRRHAYVFQHCLVHLEHMQIISRDEIFFRKTLRNALSDIGIKKNLNGRFCLNIKMALRLNIVCNTLLYIICT